jgi:hypothetical protein
VHNHHNNRSFKNTTNPHDPAQPHPPLLVARDTCQPVGVQAAREAMLPPKALYVSWSPDNAGIIEKAVQKEYELQKATVGWRKAGAGGGR